MELGYLETTIGILEQEMAKLVEMTGSTTTTLLGSVKTLVDNNGNQKEIDKG